MPRKPKVPCMQPGCAELVEPGRKYCDKHRKLHPEVTRAEAKKPYGSSRWQAVRKRYLVAHPLCVSCLAKDPPVYSKATVVDHVKPHRGDPKLFWDESNFQALCVQCHNEKTLTEDINPEYRY